MGIRSLLMIEQDEPRDLAALVVPLVGSLQRVDDPWEPCRVCDPAGVVIGPVAVYLRDLQAAGDHLAGLCDGVAAVAAVWLGGRGGLGSGDPQRGTRLLPVD